MKRIGDLKRIESREIMRSNSLNTLVFYDRFEQLKREIETGKKGEVNVGNYDGRTAEKFIKDYSDRTPILEAYVHKHDDIVKFFGFKKILDAVPSSDLTKLLFRGLITPNEYYYFTAAMKFAFYFSHYIEPEFKIIAKVLKGDKFKVELANLEKLQTKLQRDYTTEELVCKVIENHLVQAKKMFKDFREIHKKGRKPFFNDEIYQWIKKNCQTKAENVILSSILRFNEACVKTNFYRKEKKCYSYRLAPSHFNNTIYKAPFGVFMLMSNDFFGFHVRFVDIARGGIRIIKSWGERSFIMNSRRLFDEQFGLANTQQLKNKDLPEGGSKGTILLGLEHQDRGKEAFEKFVNGLLDLILPSNNGNKLIDHYGKPEFLFLGPDEHTGPYMTWACLRAKKRKYKLWKSFSTGKEPKDGGIPHDVYGVTTSGTHQYKLRILKDHGVKEEEITKCQTGGPDGDLGSNEIKISCDRTIAIIDGGGVGYDPKGLNRKELLRLATARITIDKFDRKLLSEGGFIVSVNEKDVTLPHGEVVKSGFEFRNGFHVHRLFKADLFTPCGGRPRAIAIHNVHKMFDEDGKPKFKWIVEGANLFLTDEARFILEKEGVVIIKDASCNKGGVTSSSMEVLCGLSLNDKEFKELMCEKDGKLPEFYQNYVKEILRVIKENCDLEYDGLLTLKKKGNYNYVSTQLISEKINELCEKISSSKDLWEDEVLKKNVLCKAIPDMIIQKCGYENVIKRVPENYLKSLFGCYLASRFVYKYVEKTDDTFMFFQFVNNFRK